MYVILPRVVEKPTDRHNTRSEYDLTVYRAWIIIKYSVLTTLL